ncbi:MAG: Fic family protein [Clostridia bacterium]|nr:Fic family protein [Clostridia bacterium]
MSKYDIYLYEDSKVLKNLLGITNEADLDLAESEYANAGMMFLYNSGFANFSAKGVCAIHKKLFGQVYEWAGQYRIINIQKKEEILAGQSVWYSNWDDIESDLTEIWSKIDQIKWNELSHSEFVSFVTKLFSKIWQIHPFREGNTRTTVMLIALFSEYYGYFFDYELIAASAGYFRNALVLTCFGDHSEYEHLEKILMDAISETPIDDEDKTEDNNTTPKSKYKKYYTKEYKSKPHEYLEDIKTNR